MDLKSMQGGLPKWSVDEFVHALTHALKALGRIAAVVDDADHERARQGGNHTTAEDYAHPEALVDPIADLVVCAVKMAQTRPGGAFDLDAAVIARVREKNPPGTFEPTEIAHQHADALYVSAAERGVPGAPTFLPVITVDEPCR